MLNLTSTLLRRRSVRQYTGEPIPGETLREILCAGLLAPTSRNLKPCIFTVVRDRETLEKLSKAKAAGGAFLKDADAAVVVSADAEKSDTWIEDGSIALTCMHLAAAEAGIGSCWIQIHLRKDLSGGDAEDNVRAIVGLEEKQRIVGILALGISSAEPAEHTVEDADFSKVRGI